MPSEPIDFYDRVEQLFQQADELEGGVKAAFLAEACGEDRALYAAVSELLDSDARASANLIWDQPAIMHEARWLASENDAPAFERYRILERVGVGGMGVVYKALRADDSFSKLVAVKIVHHIAEADPAGDGVRQRFRQERQILAGLDHPNIARLLDGGSTEDGRPFLVMEYVEGVPINSYVLEKKPPLHELLNLFRKICSAVSYAHRMLVVHRDLKPGNILVTPDGEPKLLDFGIAKLVDGSVERTKTGVAAMTPEYASPEQLLGTTITTASDVYSLGVLLYEFLSGRRPFRETSSALDLAHAITTAAPEPLIAPTGRRFNRDLENIVQMALRKEPGRRYVSVEQFSEDVRRFQEGYPVTARPDTRRYRAKKFIGRNKLSLAVAILVTATLVGGIVGTTIQRNQAQQQRLRAENDESNNRHLLYAAQMGLAFQAWETANVGRALDLLEAQRPASGEEDLRGFDWYMLWELAHGRSRVLEGQTEGSAAVAFSPDGSKIATASAAGKAHIWDAATGNLIRSFKTGSFRNLVFTPDGAYRFDAGFDDLMNLLQAGKSPPAGTSPAHPDIVRFLACSPDGQFVAVAAADRAIKLWRVATRELLTTLNGHKDGVTAFVFSPDGRTAATASFDHTAKLWEIPSGRELATLQGHSWYVLCLAFSPDGSLLATAGSDGDIRLWSVPSRRQIAVIRGDGSTIPAIQFAPSGRTIAVGQENSIKLYEVASRLPLDTLNGHTEPVSAIAFSSDGRYLVSGAQDRTVRVWDLAKQTDPLVLEGHQDWVSDIKFSPDGRTLGSASKDATVKLWNVSGGGEAIVLKHAQWVNGLAFSPDGAKVATADDDTSVRIWDRGSGKPLAALRGHDAVAECVVFSPDGRILASGSKNGEIILWDSAKGTKIASLHTPNNRLIWSLAFSPDGKQLIAAEGGLRDLSIASGHSVGIWDVGTRQLTATLQGHHQDVHAIALSPDGNILASGSFDGTIKFWNMKTRQEMASLRAHKVQSLAFSADGKRLVSAGMDKTIKLWDVATRQEVCTLMSPSQINSVAFSSDNRFLAVASNDGKVRLWKAATKDESAGSRSAK